MANEKLSVLDQREARALLDVGRAGVLAYSHEGRIEVTPVNYRYAGDAVYIRTTTGSTVASLGRGEDVVFLVTYEDTLAPKGWSVKTRGKITEIDASAAPVEPVPWTGEPGSVLLAIHLDEVTGRRVG